MIRFAFAPLLTLLLLFTSDHAGAQTAATLEEPDDYRMPVGYHFLKLLIPPGVREGYLVRRFISLRSDFDSSELAFGDPSEVIANNRDVVDEIYAFALQRTHGNHERAMLATAFGTFDHYEVTLDFGVKLTLPLASESVEEFRARHAHLPRNIYRPDIDDRDKLQHFFASAWLMRSLGMDWLASGIGKLVEYLEAAIVSGGSDDDRDIIANQDGIRFAASIGRDLWHPPSPYFSTP